MRNKRAFINFGKKFLVYCKYLILNGTESVTKKIVNCQYKISNEQGLF